MIIFKPRNEPENGFGSKNKYTKTKIEISLFVVSCLQSVQLRWPYQGQVSVALACTINEAQGSLLLEPEL